MWQPNCSIRTWNLVGETAQFFSQPTHLPGWIPTSPNACAARCQHTSRVGEVVPDHDPSEPDYPGVWSGLVQCGMVGAPHREEYRCYRHAFDNWCRDCGAGIADTEERCEDCDVPLRNCIRCSAELPEAWTDVLCLACRAEWDLTSSHD